MNRHIWNGIQHYESTDVLRQVAEAGIGFEMRPGSGQAQDIRACLFQAREYFHNAAEAGFTVKPLLTFYGMSHLAMALTLLLGGKGKRRLSMLPSSHGLTFVRDITSLEEASCEVLGQGTFGGFNDAMAVNQPFAIAETGLQIINRRTEELEGIQLRLKDLWGNIPGLARSHARTFQQWPAVTAVVLDASPAVCSPDDVDICMSPNLGTATGHWRALKRRLGMSTAGTQVLTDTIDLRFSVTKSLPIYLLSQTSSIPNSHVGWLCFNDSPLVPLSPLSCLLAAMFILGMIVRYKPGLWFELVRLGKGDRSVAFAREFVDHCEHDYPARILYMLDRLHAGDPGVLAANPDHVNQI